MLSSSGSYIGHEDRDSFFSIVQRHQVAYKVLATTPYGDPDLGQVGVKRLIEENVLDAAFPLHEVCIPFEPLVMAVFK